MSDEPPSSAPSSSSAAVEPAKITATVTPWDAQRMSKEQWDALDIPSFLRRHEPPPVVHTPRPASASPTATDLPPGVSAPAVDASAGDKSGLDTKRTSDEPATSPIVSGATGGFEHFRVDMNEFAQKIRIEADRRWREWMPTKEDRVRHRKSWYEKQVRKEYYP